MFDEEKLNKTIMVVRKADLFKGNSFTGFLPRNIKDYESIILEKYGWITRGFAENDPNYKQPIGYCGVINPNLKKIYAFQRSKKDQEYVEKKLQGNWSWGIGGHIELIDDKGKNPLHASIIRELGEEGGIVEVFGDVKKIQVLGYINLEYDVHLVHFGILYAIETHLEHLIGKDKEISGGGFKTINELEEMLTSPEYKVEDWSKTSLQPLKEYLASL